MGLEGKSLLRYQVVAILIAMILLLWNTRAAGGVGRAAAVRMETPR